jgi:isopentenyl phosphate kinase
MILVKLNGALLFHKQVKQPLDEETLRRVIKEELRAAK